MVNGHWTAIIASSKQSPVRATSFEGLLAMSEPELDSYKKLQPVFWWARKAVTAVAWILAGTFVWLQWKDFFHFQTLLTV